MYTQRLAGVSLPALYSLNLSQNSFSDKGWRPLARTFLSSLRLLDLSFSSASLTSIALFGEQITHLNLRGCRMVTDRDASRILLSKSLIHLDLSQTLVSENAFISREERKSSNIQKLVLHECPAFSRNLNSLCSLPKLEDLDVSDCDLIDGVLASFARNAKENNIPLKSINVGSCISLTQASIISLAEQIATLTDFRIGGCFYIKEEAVHVVISRSLSLIRHDVAEDAFCTNLQSLGDASKLLNLYS